MLPGLFDDVTRAAIRTRLAGIERRRLTGDMKRAAVLVPLCHVDGQPAVLFTKRTETVGTHKGQVSFPGGRQDPGDVDIVDTALRELEEEVGIGRACVEVLGTGHDAIAITGVAVTPVVGFVGDVDLNALTTSPHEIDVTFALSLSSLVDPQHRTLQVFGPRSAPRFSAGPHPVWGLTAYILDEVLRDAFGLALPPLSKGMT